MNKDPGFMMNFINIWNNKDTGIKYYGSRDALGVNSRIYRLLQTPDYYHDVCVIGRDQAQERAEGEEGQIIDETVKEPLADLDHGKIQNQTIRAEFKELIQSEEARARNSTNSRDIGTIPGIEFEIKLKPQSKPKALKPYPMNYEQQKIVDNQTKQLARDKIIRPSKSQFAWPVIVVPKPTRKGKREWRMCVDVRTAGSTIFNNFIKNIHIP